MNQLRNATPGHSGQEQIQPTASHNSVIHEGSASTEKNNSLATNVDSTTSFVPLGNLEPRNPSYSIPYMGIRPSRHRSMSPVPHREPPPHVYHPRTPIYAPEARTQILEAHPTATPDPPVVQQPVPLQPFIPRPLHLPQHIPPPPYAYHHANTPGHFPGYCKGDYRVGSGSEPKI
jgi:hypothetical protein